MRNDKDRRPPPPPFYCMFVHFLSFASATQLYLQSDQFITVGIATLEDVVEELIGIQKSTTSNFVLLKF
jgi:hypothetical protein